MPRSPSVRTSRSSSGSDSSRHRSPRRIALAVLLLLASAGALAGGVWYWNLQRPLPEPRTAAEALEHVGTARFENMPVARQNQYTDKAWSLLRELPREERRALREKYGDSDRIQQSMQQRFQQMLVQRALEYNQATPQERRDMSNRFRPRARSGDQDTPRNREQQAQQNGGQAGPSQRDPSRRDPAHRRERMEQFMETGNPQTGALIVEMFRHRRGEAE
ncbi:MAG: hypothetical protein ACOC1G_01020 [Phycisphaeraceae bacterium]